MREYYLLLKSIVSSSVLLTKNSLNLHKNSSILRCVRNNKGIGEIIFERGIGQESGLDESVREV